LENGAEVNCSDIKSKTALHYACIHNYKDCIRLLIKYGAEFTLKDNNLTYSDNETAVTNVSCDIIQLLSSEEIKILRRVKPFEIISSRLMKHTTYTTIDFLLMLKRL